MLPVSTYSPSLGSRLSPAVLSETLTSLVRSPGSARRPGGVGTIQPGGRVAGCVSWADTGEPGASITRTARERSRRLLGGVRWFFTTPATATVKPRGAREAQDPHLLLVQQPSPSDLWRCVLAHR